MKKQTKSNFSASLQSIAIIFAIFFVMSFACKEEGNNSPRSDKGDGNLQGGECSYQVGVGKKYGTRDPRTIENSKAPTSGAITADLAAKYLMCQREGESSDLLYLYEDAKVQVGGGISYESIMRSRVLYEIDVNHPVYPIRGSYTRKVCNRVYDENEESKCKAETVKADGYCYKTTFGDWQCRY